MIRIVWNSVSAKRFRSASTVLAVCLCMALACALGVVCKGLDDGLAVGKSRIGADILVVPSGVKDKVQDTDLLFTGAMYSRYMDAGMLEEVLATHGVEQASPQFYGQTLGGSECCSGNEAYQLIGIDPVTDWTVSAWANGGRSVDLRDGEVIVGSDVGVFPTGEGMILGHPVKVVARLDPSGTAMDDSVFMDIDTVRRYMADEEDFQAFWEGFGDPAGLVSAVLAKTEEGHAETSARHILFHNDCDTVVCEDAFGRLADQTALVTGSLIAMLGLFAIAAVFQLVSQFSGLVRERRREFGLYRALGATGGDLRAIVVGEACVLVGMGVVAGALLAYPVNSLVMRIVEQMGPVPFVAPAPGFAALWAASCAIVLAFVAILAVMPQLVLLKRVDPSAAMQRRDTD